MNSIAQPGSPATTGREHLVQSAAKAAPSMRDLLEDGIYLLFLLRSKNAPVSCAEFNRRIDQYLTTFERVCRTFEKPLDAIVEAKYAFCALLDEIVLSSGLPIRDEWEAAPLQLRLFGEHLAGEGFFDRLERLRQDPAANIELLEIFHTCLLLGFQGKFLLEGSEKLNYLIARLGQEIAAVRGPSKGFAPRWKIPFKFNQYVRHEIPLWLYYALLALAAVAVFFTFQWSLDTKTSEFPSLLKAEPVQQLTPPAQVAPSVTPGAQPLSQGQQAAAVEPESYSNDFGDSQLHRSAEAKLRREAESEAASLKGRAKSTVESTMRSAIH